MALQLWRYVGGVVRNSRHQRLSRRSFPLHEASRGPQGVVRSDYFSAGGRFHSSQVLARQTAETASAELGIPGLLNGHEADQPAWPSCDSKTMKCGCGAAVGNGLKPRPKGQELARIRGPFPQKRRPARARPHVCATGVLQVLNCRRESRLLVRDMHKRRQAGKFTPHVFFWGMR